jgi:2-polyprenyl-6-methoxyphenol hydroxylase-like FAD-dependent oxidoreductase
MSKLNILISGGGIAGPCLAWWLHKRLPSVSITITERFSEPRTSGQAVDIRDAGVEVIQLMGLQEKIQSKHTTEEGIEFIYADGKTKAQFGASGDVNAQSMTSEFEILRGDLAKIFYDETKDMEGVKYVFGENIISIHQQENGKVSVKFANQLPETEYDLVVGADGMLSQTRRRIWGRGPKDNDFLRRLGQYMAYFTIPRIESDTKWAQWYNAPNGRLVFLRPSPYQDTRGYLAVTDGNLSKFDKIKSLMEKGRETQMDWLEEEFQGADWQTERVLKGMRAAPDFYMQETAQVKLEEFVKERVALIGDAGYAPSPISGMGTTLAIVGAYVLAGELSKLPSDAAGAAQQYQQVLRPFVNKCQSLPPGAPQLVNPQTKWGIATLNTVISISSSKYIQKFALGVASLLPNTKWKLPDYPAVGQ